MTIENIKITIEGWDDLSNSILLKFSTDTDNIESSTLSYQPSYFESTDLDEVLKIIAKSGFSILETEYKRNQIKKDKKLISKYKKLIGKTFSYTIKDIFK